MMDWSTSVTAILTAVTTGGGVTVAAIWILKTWTGKRVQHEFDLRLAGHKLELDKQLAAYQTLFANVAGKQVHAITELYRLLAKAARGLRAAVKPIQYVSSDAEVAKRQRNEQLAEVQSDVNAFSRFLYENRPLIDDDLYRDLTEFDRLLMRVWDRGIVGTAMTGDYRLQDGAWNEAKERFGPLLDRINTRARELLERPADVRR